MNSALIPAPTLELGVSVFENLQQVFEDLVRQVLQGNQQEAFFRFDTKVGQRGGEKSMSAFARRHGCLEPVHLDIGIKAHLAERREFIYYNQVIRGEVSDVYHPSLIVAVARIQAESPHVEELSQFGISRFTMDYLSPFFDDFIMQAVANVFGEQAVHEIITHYAYLNDIPLIEQLVERGYKFRDESKQVMQKPFSPIITT